MAAAAVAPSLPPTFALVYADHFARVRATAARLLRDPAAAEEIAQDVFLWYWTNADRYDPERGSLAAFLTAAARGRAIDRIRSESARRRREERDAREQPPVVGAAEVDGVQAARAGELARALDSLPDPERQAITLAYFGGHTYREVAELLGEPEGTIKSRIRSGLRRLRPAVA
jgi:RNA polymerase sigma-70 factor, ECF subfamily